MALKLFVTIAVLLAIKTNGQGQDLSFTYYEKTCPQVEKIVSDGMKSLSFNDPRIPPAILRLLFNDCRVRGCDASILIDVGNTSKFEMGSPNNFGITKREVIGEIKSMVDKVCPQQISCTDVLVLAAREAVAITGGPTIKVPLGRRDSPVARSVTDADGALPLSDEIIGGAVGKLADIVNTEEAIALIGAHTIGQTHCSSLQQRLYPKTPGFSQNETEFMDLLRKTCPEGASSQYTTSVPNDPTPQTFDNKFFVNSLNGHGVLLLDSDMAYENYTKSYVQKFANDEGAFFSAFSSAFVKLSSFEVLTGNRGLIRKQCNKIE